MPHARMPRLDTLTGTPTCHTRAVIHAPRRDHVQSPPLLQVGPTPRHRLPVPHVMPEDDRRAPRSRLAGERPCAIRSRSDGWVGPEPDKATPNHNADLTHTPNPPPAPHPPSRPPPESPWPPRQRPPGGERSPARRGHRRASRCPDLGPLL